MEVQTCGRQEKETARQGEGSAEKETCGIEAVVGNFHKAESDHQRRWINYFRIGSMKGFLDKFGQWLRYKVRVIIIKQWKKPKRIYINLQRLNIALNANMTDEEIFKVANSRLGWYRR